MFEVIVKKEGLNFLGWREVPIHPEILGENSCGLYAVYYAGVHRAAGKSGKRAWILTGSCMLSAAYLSRATMTLTWYPCPAEQLYIKVCSLVGQLRQFFSDLQDEDYESAIAMVHSRFSTNTNAQLGEGASEPVYRSQWRDQYHPRQCG